jgi:Secretion system C-terminal sorting domain
MMHRYTPVVLATVCAAALPALLAAQACTPLTNALVGSTMLVSPGGTGNFSAVVYNPDADLYYCFNAGSSSYPANTFDGTFTFLDAVPQGFDYRGAWWNPNTAQVEGNGYNVLGIFVQDLDAITSYPLGTGSVILPSAQPDQQSVGAYDPAGNVILYYFNGSISRYARADNTLLGTTAITGLPVGTTDINSNTVVYTGCAGYELAVFDWVARRVLFVDGSTYAYAGACQLPPDAPARASFGMSYSNDRFWLFDDAANPGTWRSYQVLSGTQSVTEAATAPIDLFPNPAQEVLGVSTTGSAPERSVRVVDLTGRAVPCPVRAAGVGSYQLDVSALANGTYALLLDTDDGSVRRTFMVAR